MQNMQGMQSTQKPHTCSNPSANSWEACESSVASVQGQQPRTGCATGTQLDAIVHCSPAAG